jgi:tRNA (cytidine32/uridine32-2'-O)-methyltransferase
MDSMPNVRVVLMQTSHPGNIGAAARAMKTMCLERLYLVRPQQFPHANATARAAGAEDILANATLCGSLDEALQDAHLVIGTSTRSRSLAWPQLDPRTCAERILTESAAGEAALVFGPERAGLSNAELDRCHFVTAIPCNPAYRSLNLAAAVQVLCYELMMRAQDALKFEVVESEEPLAEAGDLELFYQHLEQTLIELGFLNPTNPRYLIRRLRRLFNRARLTDNEVNILRGILSATRASRAG